MKLVGRSITILATELFRASSTLATGIVLSRLLTKAEYGTFSQAFMVYTLFSTILALSLPQSLYYFIPQSSSGDRPRIMSQTLILTIILAAFAGGAMHLGAGPLSQWMNNPNLAPVIRVMSFYPLADMVSQLICPALISVNRAGSSAVFGVIFSVVRIASIVWPAAAGFTLPNLIHVMVLAAFVTAIIGLVMIVTTLHVRTPWLSRSLLREQVSYSLPLAGALTVGLLGRQLDKWIISLFFNPEQYAVFSNGAMELPLVGVLTGGLASAILPDMVQSVAQNRVLDAVGLWQRSSRVCALAMFPMFVLSLILAPELMVLLFSPRYLDSTYPFMIYLFVLPMRVVIYASLLRALSSTKPIMIGAVLALAVNATLGLALVVALGKTTGGFLAPAVASVISQYLSGWYLLVAIRKVSSVPIRKVLPWQALVRLLLLSVAVGLATLPIFLFKLATVPKILIISAIYAVAYSLVLRITHWLSADELKIINRILPWHRPPQPAATGEGR